ncbi:hypothetical protein BDW71DRAFT_127650 [Aspergillus fruticulosus]
MFLNFHRPAKRSLYFRFLITYVYAGKKGNSAFTSTVESRTKFWQNPGKYLEYSTLKSLARNISALKLPMSLSCEQTLGTMRKCPRMGVRRLEEFPLKTCIRRSTEHGRLSKKMRPFS